MDDAGRRALRAGQNQLLAHAQTVPAVSAWRGEMVSRWIGKETRIRTWSMRKPFGGVSSSVQPTFRCSTRYGSSWRKRHGQEETRSERVGRRHGEEEARLDIAAC